MLYRTLENKNNTNEFCMQAWYQALNTCDFIYLMHDCDAEPLLFPWMRYIRYAVSHPNLSYESHMLEITDNLNMHSST